MEKSSNKILLTVLGIAVLVVATIGATFAYFSATKEVDAGSVQTGVLVVDATATAIDKQNVSPTKFVKGEDNDNVGHGTITVDTSDTTVTDAYYDIYLTASLTDYTQSTPASGAREDVKYVLYDGDAVIAQGTFATDLTNQKITTAPIEINDETATKTYDLYIYVNETGVEQNDLQGVTASATLSVQAQTPKYPAE